MKRSLHVLISSLSETLIAHVLTTTSSDSQTQQVLLRGSTKDGMYVFPPSSPQAHVGSNSSVISHFISVLTSDFPIKDLGSLHYFLGVECHHTFAGLMLCQWKYILDLLNKTNMMNCKPVISPMSFSTKLSAFDSTPVPDPMLYRSVVGSLHSAPAACGGLMVIMALLSPTLSLAFPGFDFDWGGRGQRRAGGMPLSLFPEFYQYSCPQANHIVMSVLERAISEQPRMAASLLRLHFHDCFVQGCDGSVLLDDSPTIVSEKRSAPNRNSLRGFEVIDEIKAKLEEACPQTVSCADILALAARGSTVLSGGPNWALPLGRRDSRTASLTGSNRHIPAPNSTLQNLITFFNRQGLDKVDLVALSGGHTIGVARCATFKQRLYNQNGKNQPDETLEKTYYHSLKSVCPRTGGDNNISPLDLASPAKFDNTYFKLLLWGRGLLTSDQVLLTGNGNGNFNAKTMELVRSYAEDEALFFHQFAKSMVKMGNISPLTGFNGEIRKNCRRVN
ncbi:peroxidase 9 [Malania oleifera]|uniref:peroxidase 9 n=1 Tax=Malania oleifera TaxID=397392 RepID=UPI0025ADF520|nr:peroxidase 9 [Malania oleifera]